ncbi:hypothetical protein M9H77_23728 [Catharanthus roseus]|uniref:Uncharacterized protein n=1 Tax=Catharanthus roseus TaxID=4058 RepID=A0ACC0AU56_CATRO|nr:hypothetical protein M9H77_23728 [Catharanthus roseus]
MPELVSDDCVMGFELCPWSPTVALHVLLNLGVEAASMCLDSLRLPGCVRTPHIGSNISAVKATKELYFLITLHELTTRGAVSRFSMHEVLRSVLRGSLDSLGCDVNRKSQAPMELKLGPPTRAQGKKFKIYDDNVANGLVVFMEEALKNKLEGFEDKGNSSKLLSICTISKDHSMARCWRIATLPLTVALPLLSLVGFWLEID